jgi:predicted DNA-binding transcriptional regulator YafY
MSQRQQLERILEIDRQIRARRYPNAQSLARALEVSVRTIYGDREFLVDRLHAPIEHDPERGGWFYSDETWALPNIFITEGELLAFFLSAEVAQRYLGTDFEAPLRSAIAKLAASLGSQVQVSLEQLREHYTFAAPASPHVDARLLVALHRAIEQQRQVQFRYYSASRDEWRERAVNPHHLYNMRGDWYLFAFDQLRREMRNFHLGRVSQWQVLAEGFERVPNFSAEAWMQTAFQGMRGEEPEDVAIRFDAYQARWIRERRWHQTQAPLEELDDGGVILRFRTGGLDEVKHWVLQYGGHAEVLEPERLRRMVVDELRDAGMLYGLIAAQRQTAGG